MQLGGSDIEFVASSFSHSILLQWRGHGVELMVEEDASSVCESRV